MSEPTVTLHVTRYHPEHDSAPRRQSYSVPYRQDWVVLDALNYIKDQIDGTLTFRWSCRMGVCGSCGMMVNGVPRLTCAAFLREYYPHEIRVEPLTNFPIMRDLVIDMSDFMHKLSAVKPIHVGASFSVKIVHTPPDPDERTVPLRVLSSPQTRAPPTL